MSYQAIIEYLSSLAKAYFVANKFEKSHMLNHAAQVTGYSRKGLIRSLKTVQNEAHKSEKKRCGAEVKYSKDLLMPHIKFLWIEMGKISGKRMKAAYTDWLPQYHENEVNNHIKYLLQKMSVSTLERFITDLRSREKKEIRGLCSTSPAKYMQNKVPINTLDSTISKVGFMQADTVAHCGTRLEGEFINSITLTDIFSTWTVNKAIYSKKGPVVRKALDHMRQILPFKIIAINTDSGSEFLNVPVFNGLKKDSMTGILLE